jgi:nucleoside phosphorylase
MIKILLVEDDTEKARLVAAALLEVTGISAGSISRCSSAFDAKKLLKTTHFDLMILDINIPTRTDQKVRTGGGLEISRALHSKPGYQVPSHVIGLSAYEEGVTEAKRGFENPFWRIVRFAADESAWRQTLKTAAESIVKNARFPPLNDGHTFHTTLGIVVGLEDVELKSVLELSPSFSQVVVPHDPTRYFKGHLERGERRIDVVVAAAPKMGLVTSAVVTTKLIENFRPKYLAMSGICAGVKEETGLGDVLVADPCWDWGSGKVSTGANGEEVFAAAPYQWRLDAQLRSVCKDIASDKIWLDDLYAKWPEGRPENKPKVLIEAMASGASVLARKTALAAIRRQHKNLIGIEMEIYAVITAAELASAPRPLAIAAKSVCDFGEEDKDGKVQRYAAYTSAQFLEELAFRTMIASDEDDAEH